MNQPKRIGSSGHHVHNVEDCAALVRQLGYTPGKTTDTADLAEVESAADESTCTITLNKRTGTLTVDCPYGPTTTRFNGTSTAKKGY